MQIISVHSVLPSILLCILSSFLLIIPSSASSTSSLSSFIITLPASSRSNRQLQNELQLDERKLRKQKLYVMMKALESEQRKHRPSLDKYEPQHSIHTGKEKSIHGAEYDTFVNASSFLPFERSSSSTSPSFDARITGTFEHIIDGFTADLTPTAVRFLREQYDADIYPDIILSAPVIGPPVVYPIPSSRSPNYATVDNATSSRRTQLSNQGIIDAVTATSWGLDRIDQTVLPLDGIYHHFLPNPDPSEPVDIYFIDSGIRTTHDEFTDRIISGRNFLPDQTETNYSDCAGHGSHVTGTATGNTLGIGRTANLIIVRVLSCDAAGALRYVLRGLDWTLAQITETLRTKPSQRIVINLSVATQRMTVLDEAVEALAQAGAIVVIAAGNTANDACNTSPAAASSPSNGIFSVGSSDREDTYSSFSDYGNCVSIVAPGRSIVSIGIDSDTSLAIMTGTSMACPHVTGMITLLLQYFPTATVKEISDILQCTATVNQLRQVPNRTPNRLLYSSPLGILRSCLPSSLATLYPDEKAYYFINDNQYTAITPPNTGTSNNGQDSTGNDITTVNNEPTVSPVVTIPSRSIPSTAGTSSPFPRNWWSTHVLQGETSDTNDGESLRSLPSGKSILSWWSKAHTTTLCIVVAASLYLVMNEAFDPADDEEEEEGVEDTDNEEYTWEHGKSEQE